MKTIPWSKFVELVAKTDFIRVDNIDVITSTTKDTVTIYWEKEGEEYQFTFESDRNEEVLVKDNSATVFCNEYGIDVFNFEFFNLTPVKI